MALGSNGSQEGDLNGSGPKGECSHKGRQDAVNNCHSFDTLIRFTGQAVQCFLFGCPWKPGRTRYRTSVATVFNQNDPFSQHENCYTEKELEDESPEQSRQS